MQSNFTHTFWLPVGLCLKLILKVAYESCLSVIVIWQWQHAVFSKTFFFFVFVFWFLFSSCYQNDTQVMAKQGSVSLWSFQVSSSQIILLSSFYNFFCYNYSSNSFSSSSSSHRLEMLHLLRELFHNSDSR